MSRMWWWHRPGAHGRDWLRRLISFGTYVARILSFCAYIYKTSFNIPIVQGNSLRKDIEVCIGAYLLYKLLEDDLATSFRVDIPTSASCFGANMCEGFAALLNITSLWLGVYCRGVDDWLVTFGSVIGCIGVGSLSGVFKASLSFYN